MPIGQLFTNFYFFVKYSKYFVCIQSWMFLILTLAKKVKSILRNFFNTSTVTDEQMELLRALIVVDLFVGGGRLPLSLQGLPDLPVVYPPCDAQRQRKAQDRPFKHTRMINISYISLGFAQRSVTFQVVNSLMERSMRIGKNYYLTSWR
jgi:hypothetical protein